jgi:hypothetical protein
MFCRNCGAQIDPACKFCIACGAGNLGVAPAPPRRGRRVAWLLWGGGVIVFLLILATLNSPTNRSPGNSTSDSDTRTTAPHAMNQTVNVGVWSYEVTGARWANSIGSEFDRETPDAKFLLVELTIRNNDRTSSTLPPLKLIDSEQREYDESSKGAFLEGSFGLLKSVNPGVTASGTVVFDVPAGTYWLVAPGGFGSNETATIRLE